MKVIFLNDMEFSEKVKHFMKVYLPGLDISGDKDIEDVYRHDDYFNIRDNLEKALLDEIKHYISPRLIDEIESKYGTKNAENITEEINERINYMQQKVQRRFEEREDKARTFSLKIDSIGIDLDKDTEQGKNLRSEIITEINEQIESDFGIENPQRKYDLPTRVNRLKEELMPYLETVMISLDVSYMARRIEDIFGEYELKAKKINELTLECVEDIKKSQNIKKTVNVSQEYEETPQMPNIFGTTNDFTLDEMEIANEPEMSEMLREPNKNSKEDIDDSDVANSIQLNQILGISPDEVINNYIKGYIVNHDLYRQTLIPEDKENGIPEIAYIGVKKNKEPENGEPAERGVLISESILKEAIANDNHQLFDDNKDYMVIKGEHFYQILSKEEHEKVQDHHLRKVLKTTEKREEKVKDNTYDIEII